MKAVFFDLDGTLVDSREGIVNCLRYALETLGVPLPDDARLEACIGPPLQASLADLVGSERADEALRLYRERYERTGIFEQSVYPGAPEMLDAVRRRGLRVVLLTSKPSVYARRIVERFGLADRFDALYGSELNGDLTRKEDLIRHALQQERLAPSDAVMVGDRSHDIEGARANGVASIGVAWGFGSREELIAAGAGQVCEAPWQISECRFAISRKDISCHE